MKYDRFSKKLENKEIFHILMCDEGGTRWDSSQNFVFHLELIEFFYVLIEEHIKLIEIFLIWLIFSSFNKEL